MITPPVWAVELAERFWSAAGSPPPFPRELSSAITDGTLLSIVERPGLTLATVLDELRPDRLPAPFREPDRPLRAALYCWRGVGFVFLDSADPPDERRFSLAHELAHFLRDCDDIRRRAATALGPAALDILDGARPATVDERVAAALRGLSLAPHAHLMSRDSVGRPAGDAERDAEARADRLAFELLSPASELAGEADRAALTVRLVTAFGLPSAAARAYSHLLLPEPPSCGSVVERLRKFW